MDCHCQTCSRLSQPQASHEVACCLALLAIHQLFELPVECRDLLSLQPPSALVRIAGIDGCRKTIEGRDAVLAVAKHLVLRTPDKADFRAVAVDAAAVLVAELPAVHQNQYVLFTARLAQTSKVPASSCCLLSQSLPHRQVLRPGLLEAAFIQCSPCVAMQFCCQQA